MANLRKAFIFETEREADRFTVEKWTEICRDAIVKKGRFAAAVSGGRTPRNVYQQLAESAASLPWEQTHIFLVDERLVPYSHHDSNFGMVTELLLRKVGIPGKNCHPIPVEPSSPQDLALEYQEDLRIFFRLAPKELPEFDLILLGAGKDGHTASLFPGSQTLADKTHLAAGVILDDSRHDRVTLTLPVLNRACNVIFMISGEEKAAILKRVFEEKDGSLPASLVDPAKGNLFFVADRDAASMLTSKNPRETAG